jgi:hypothetical protein
MKHRRETQETRLFFQMSESSSPSVCLSHKINQVATPQQSNPIESNPTHTPTTTKIVMTKSANSSTSSTSSSSSSSSLNDSSFDIVLPSSFVPGPHHVICARGKSYWDHEGNKSYRAMIAASARKYAKSCSKLDKSIIVSEIIHALQQKASAAASATAVTASDHDGCCCFVKQQQQQQHGKGISWVQCNDQFAREKVSQSLRDALHGQYRSSFTAKKQRRTHASKSIIARVEQVILSNASIARQIQRMTHDLLKSSETTSSSASWASSSSSFSEQHHDDDSTIFTMLSRANLDILESLKRDSSLLTQFQEATCC